MPETSVQRRDEALPDKSGVSMSSISLSLEAEICPEDVRFVRYSRQLCNIVGSVKSFPVQDDGHFLTLCRYVERNALRAGLVERAEQWRWCSLWRGATRKPPEGPALSPWPIERPSGWSRRVNVALSPAEEEAIRRAIQRGQPFGDTVWQVKTAQRLGLVSTLRPIGRPRASLVGDS